MDELDPPVDVDDHCSKKPDDEPATSSVAASNTSSVEFDDEAETAEDADDMNGGGSLASTPEPIDILKVLDQATLCGFASLCVTVLRLDFAEDWNVSFRKTTFEAVVKRLAIPTKTVSAMLQHLNSSTSEEQDKDLSTYILTIRNDPYLAERGCIILITDLIGVLIQHGAYDARHRVLLKHVSALLGVDWTDVQTSENTLACLLTEDAYEESPEEIRQKKKRERRKKLKRWAIIGGSGVVGGVLIGLTAGLAAPLFATGLGVIIGTSAAAGIGTAAGAAVIGSLFGVAGAGLAGYKVNRRVGEMEEFTIETLSNGKSLQLAIGISGWIIDDREDNFRWSWRNLQASDEQYILRYESKYLLELGKAVEYLMSYAVSYGIQQTLMQTALSSLVAAIAWPITILTVANIADNPWSVCIGRSAEVGIHLAQLLISRKQGRRPVTLIGFSLGARVIYHCLLELSKRKDFDGIIEDVVLMGAPITANPDEWRKVARVAAGRIINAYCTTDWLLKFLYRTMNLQFSIAGTAPVVLDVPKVLNINVTHIVKGHTDYLYNLTEVMEACGVRINKPSGSSASLASGGGRKQNTVMASFPSTSSANSSPSRSSSSNLCTSGSDHNNSSKDHSTITNNSAMGQRNSSDSLLLNRDVSNLRIREQ